MNRLPLFFFACNIFLVLEEPLGNGLCLYG
jgi:hypothetical protein